MWKLKESLSSEEKDTAKTKIKDMLEALNGRIDGLISAEVGFNFKSGSYDLCLITELLNKESLEFYQVHPEHVKCKQYIGEVTAERGFCDYEF